MLDNYWLIVARFWLDKEIICLEGRLLNNTLKNILTDYLVYLI